MAEAQQEQPQAHQPQPEPVSAAAEEVAHALPHQSRAKSPSSQATQEQENIQGAQGQVQVRVEAQSQTQSQTQTQTQAEPDAQDFDFDAHARARAPTSNVDSANNATTTVAAAHAQEQEWAQEKDREKEQDREQGYQLLSDHSTTDGFRPTSTPTSTSTPATASPAADPVATTLATDQATLSSATVATNGALPDQQEQKQHQHQQQQEAVAPSPEVMSNNPPHHPQGPPRQPASYPNPTAYPASAMATTHYGYANPAGQGADAYRASVGVPSNAMALPSMRTFDPAQQQAQQQQHMAMAMPVNPVPSVPSMPAQQHMSYFAQQPVPMTANNPYALPSDALRPQYALPPSGPGSVLGGRHKKEIKRRTKTGCLTCRKRRIKCDEQHPICKNCQKSKRECLGYDPIFKNQQQQHHTNIRPAPNNSSASSSAAPSSRPPASSTPASGSAQTQTSYTATLPPVISNTTPTTAPFAGNLTAAGTAASSVKGEPALEYPVAIDPTLDTVLSTTSTSPSHFQAITPITPISPHNPFGTSRLRGGPPKMKVHELVGMTGTVPPTLDSPLTADKLADVRDLYDQVYAPGLEKFFETEWYTKPQGIGALMSSTAVNEMLAGFLQSMAKTDANDVAGMQYSANLEFRVVWDLTTLVYTSEYKINVGEHLPPPDDGSEARNRVAVFEALLSGDHLDQNPLHPPPANADIRLHRIREFKFWYFLAEFLRVRDQPGVDTMRQRDYILGQLRELLDGRENRDVLYSLAVIRALAPNFPPDFESTLPPHLDETDPKSKLAVARKFVQDESQVTGGTTNVVRRFSELAVRAFIAPGSNITRR
ncbi:hypothetical protein F5Y00DRAFT_256025 [Daldinia vernicosa]|uniref:uncharacterized protein n=1 Tax=Daldinia vernicosa TaxID=114800 RepID=UPI0020080D8E|nr:uncharacterized protein F5Y00DRAFT_256025 [Daldinia vernicosa]KAI0844424.1 hypothetical protein F5Y00DRAFT_256025 [Daldinia vernicosa]